MITASHPPSSLPISVVIPFKDKAKMTLDCLRSLMQYGPPVDEILLLSNNSSDTELETIRQGAKDMPHVKVLIYNHPFNYQKINNWGIEQAKAKFILMLNNDIELKAQSVGLIERMYQKAAEPEVGIVGCTLLYGDGKTIQHGGVYLMPKGPADAVYVGRVYARAIASDRDQKIFPYDISKDLPMTAVTGAAQMVEAKKFRAVGGFDERFIVCSGDVDLCIRLNNKGFQTWFLGGGYMIHKESQSRKNQTIPYSDFYWGYLSYMQAFDVEKGDKYLPLITDKKEYQ